MASTAGPLLSFRASGTVASTLAYGRNRSGAFVRIRTMPGDPRSQRQVAYRSALAVINLQWPRTPAAWLPLWDDFPPAQTLSRYHAYARFNLLRFRQQLTISCRPYPTSIYAHPNYGTPTIQAVDGRAVITVPWTYRGGAAGIYLHRDTSPSPPKDFVHTIGLASIHGSHTQTYVDVPPTPGHYYYRLQPWRICGGWSPVLPELDVVT